MQSQPLNIQPIPEKTPTPQTEYPTPQTEAYQQQNDFISVDDFLADTVQEAAFSADTVVNEAGTPEVNIDRSIAAGDQPPMDESEAMKQTRTLMDMRETAQSLGLSYIADGSLDGYERYKYETWQKNLLVEAWTPIIQSMGIRVNPWLKVLYAEGISTTPIAVLAFNNRKARLKIEQQAAYIRHLEHENANLKTTTPPPPSKPLRNDTKNQWAVDENGYFENTIAGKYIPKATRKEKPDLTPEAYELLCKHNGKDFIDDVFHING